MNKIIILYAAAAVALSTNSAVADQSGGLYGGVQFASFDVSDVTVGGATIPEDFSPTGLIFRLGNNVNENFSVEGRLGLGLSDDTITVSDGIDTVSLSIELDTLIGVYGVGHVILSESSSVYGLIGITKVDGTLSASLSGGGSGSLSDDETGLSFGVGADIGLSNTVALNIEYIQYLNKSAFDVSALAFGVKFGF